MKTRALLALGLVFSLFCGVASYAADAPADVKTDKTTVVKKEAKHGKKVVTKKHKKVVEAAPKTS